MRASLFSAAVAVALAATVWSPRDAQAQIIISPQISGSPYTSYGYSYPTYSYGYPYNYGSSFYNYNWNTPYSSYSRSWYNSPTYTGYSNYYWNNSPYYGGYRSGYRGWRRW